MPDKEIVNRVAAAVRSVDPSLDVRVTSGRQLASEQYGSSRHNSGNTMDFQVMRNGMPVPTSDPIHVEVVGALTRHGINEIGIGMNDGAAIHAGFSSGLPAMWAYGPFGEGSKVFLKDYPEHVKAVQRSLGVGIDGIYGSDTQGGLAAVDIAIPARVPSPVERVATGDLAPMQAMEPPFGSLAAEKARATQELRDSLLARQQWQRNPPVKAGRGFSFDYGRDDPNVPVRPESELFNAQPSVPAGRPAPQALPPRSVPTAPIPRPNPERIGALPDVPERRAMKAYAAVVEEIEGIERLLRTDRRAYFRDEKKQERYRELLAIREKNRAWA
jgi:hypothetical protein